MNKQIFAIAAAMALSAPVLAADKTPAAANAVAKPIPVFLLHETAIPFANFNGIQDFEPVSDLVVFVQGRNRQWYRAKTFGPCFGLDHAIGIAFETNADGSFDRFSAIRVGGQRCQLESVAQSDQPWTRKDLVKD